MKFKVGDRVRVIYREPDWYGKEGTVLSVHPYRMSAKIDYVTDIPNLPWSRGTTWSEQNLERVNNKELL